MSIELNHPELLNKCIRCKNTDVSLTNYSFIQILGIETVKAFQINFSVCGACAGDVNRIFKRAKIIKGFKKFSIIAMIISILSIWFYSAMYSSGISSLIVAVVGTIITFISVIIVNIILIFYFRIWGLEKFIKIKKDGTVYLKDPLNKQQSSRFNLIESINKVQQSYKFCPHCGSTQKTETGFCMVCGKNIKKEVNDA